MEINFVTSNNGKVQSLVRSFKEAQRYDIKINQITLNIIEPQLDKAAEIFLFKALEAFKRLNSPVLVEDGGLEIPALNGFPGVFSKYVLATIGIEGILKLMKGEKRRGARFVSFATFIGSDGIPYQFEREGDNFEIAQSRSRFNKTDKRTDAWSELDQILFIKDYGKFYCELSEQELVELNDKSTTRGSIQKFAKWFLERY